MNTDFIDDCKDSVYVLRSHIAWVSNFQENATDESSFQACQEEIRLLEAECEELWGLIIDAENLLQSKERIDRAERLLRESWKDCLVPMNSNYIDFYGEDIITPRLPLGW